MIDSLAPLPNINPPRIIKAHVTEENPHHINNEFQKKKRYKHTETTEEEIEDEIVVLGQEITENSDATQKIAPVRNYTFQPLHNIDIEA